MRLLVLSFLLPTCALTMPSCSLFKSQEPSSAGEKTPEGPKLVGRIASVPKDKRFVLIQSYDSWNIESGTILTTRGLDERTANLLVTGEALGQFAAADIQSGSVEIGDAVYSRHVPNPKETPPGLTPAPELPQNQLESKIGNVQKNN